MAVTERGQPEAAGSGAASPSPETVPPAAEFAAPQQAAEPAPPQPQPGAQRSSGVRKITFIVLAIALAIFAYTLISDRLTPYTALARVQAYLVQIVPEVSGKVVALEVSDNEIVMAGSVLFKIETTEYEIAILEATAELEAAGQSVGASTAGIAAAEANLARTLADLENVREQAGRIFELVDKGIYAEARRDQATASLGTAEASVNQARAELEEARVALGPQGEDNPEIRAATARLRAAQLDLARTTVYAPSDGAVTALQLTLGQVVTPQASAMTYIDVREIWIDAEFRENSLENMQPGNEVEVVLDIRPGRVYRAQVVSVGFGVSSGEIDQQTGLPVIREPAGWFRDPQRLPVRIEFLPGERPQGVRFGSQANIMVYTGDNPVVNMIGRIWMRFVAYMSYLR